MTREEVRKYGLERRRKKKAQGICYDCTEKALDGVTRCEKHLISKRLRDQRYIRKNRLKRRLSDKKRHDRYRLERRCLGCGMDLTQIEGYTNLFCPACTDLKNSYR